MVSRQSSQSPPPRRPQLPHEFVLEFRRDSTALALSAVVHERGLQALTVGAITAQARMARQTFYELFGSRHEAVAYSIRLGNKRLRSSIDHAAMIGDEWEQRVAAVIGSLLESVATDPHLAELCLLHAPGAQGTPVPFDSGPVESLAGVLRPIRAQTKSVLPGPRTEELVAVSILAVIAARLGRDEVGSLDELGSELTAFAVGPFIGSDRPS